MSRVFSSFGYWYRDQAPQWIWDHLRTGGRKNKDVTAPLIRLLNKTKVYDYFLKSNSGYCTFVLMASVVSGAAWVEGFDVIWDRINKGRQYKDLPYTYPVEED
eukprot:GHVS01031878.1.p1 GENE.GHVS01031878.1~~GHVS01031878.1.p1  ORF type:complete len:103 (+),score=14.40 GHVS01031878.1:116-424(+)